MKNYTMKFNEEKYQGYKEPKKEAFDFEHFEKEKDLDNPKKLLNALEGHKGVTLLDVRADIKMELDDLGVLDTDLGKEFLMVDSKLQGILKHYAIMCHDIYRKAKQRLSKI